ncbi:hypothetical protein BBAD15_g6045 [Beauveria bassiana D1-5]|uniref:Uncharacterized protein n=1 Tax=Beauveria bassiana D1-5 TaxID=1245745 RepID=A0A0A2VLA6_BEABA|nr:hypothetical protein BBAD15_g6045 [Beauveria bassiana D1-5]
MGPTATSASARMDVGEVVLALDEPVAEDAGAAVAHAEPQRVAQQPARLQNDGVARCGSEERVARAPQRRRLHLVAGRQAGGVERLGEPVEAGILGQVRVVPVFHKRQVLILPGGVAGGDELNLDANLEMAVGAEGGVVLGHDDGMLL